MQVINIKNKEELNKFVGSQDKSQFLQSWQWGELQYEISGPIFRLGIEDGGELAAAMTIIQKELPMGKSYFYCPRGPIMDLKYWGPETCELLFNEIEIMARNEGAMFLRFDPIFNIPPVLTSEEGQADFIAGQSDKFQIQQTIDVQPSRTLMLDLIKSQDELLKNMHQKTRYNIRLAEKKGVKIIEADFTHFDSFWRLLGETKDRDKFRSHGHDYYIEMLKVDPNFIRLFIAEYNGKAIAANIVSFFGDTVTYLHGASSNEYRNTMAPYLLQRYVIRQAKEFGYKYYDFNGIDEKKWPGVTRFKKGFSGEEVEYPGTFDLIFDKGWYSVYKMVRRARRTF
jgi:lipid II:glycine glycyltransferase (peptidoglycan interpeptide bridge formation enzyme)